MRVFLILICVSLFTFTSRGKNTKLLILKKDWINNKDSIVISRPITNEIAGSAYRKRAKAYQIVHGNDTSAFQVIFLKSNKNEFDTEGSVHFEVKFDKKRVIWNNMRD